MFVPLALCLLIAAKPPPDPRLDLLDAMVEEINRNQAELKLRENRGPYFIGYQLKDYDSREVAARYGAVFQDATTPRSEDLRRRAGGRLRPSTPRSVTSSTSTSRSRAPATSPGRARRSTTRPPALRTALWLVTDEKYKPALFNFLKKKGDDVYAVDDPKRPPSFSKESPEVQLHRARRRSPSTRERWVAFAREVSARLATEKAFFDSEVRITGDKIVRYFVDHRGHAPGDRGHALRGARAGVHPRRRRPAARGLARLLRAARGAAARATRR